MLHLLCTKIRPPFRGSSRIQSQMALWSNACAFQTCKLLLSGFRAFSCHLDSCAHLSDSARDNVQCAGLPQTSLEIENVHEEKDHSDAGYHVKGLARKLASLTKSHEA